MTRKRRGSVESTLESISATIMFRACDLLSLESNLSCLHPAFAHAFHAVNSVRQVEAPFYLAVATPRSSYSRNNIAISSKPLS